MEENSLLYTIIKNVATIFGFLTAALFMFLGIMDYKQALEQAKTPKRHASAAFLLVVFVFYFITFLVFAIIQCVDAFKLISSTNKIAPMEIIEPEPRAQHQPQPQQ